MEDYIFEERKKLFKACILFYIIANMPPMTHTRENYAVALRKQSRIENILKKRILAKDSNNDTISNEDMDILMKIGIDFNNTTNDVGSII